MTRHRTSFSSSQFSLRSSWTPTLWSSRLRLSLRGPWCWTLQIPGVCTRTKGKAILKSLSMLSSSSNRWSNRCLCNPRRMFTMKAMRLIACLNNSITRGRVIKKMRMWFTLLIILQSFITFISRWAAVTLLTGEVWYRILKLRVTIRVIGLILLPSKPSGPRDLQAKGL
jgi:hypothetical protein